MQSDTAIKIYAKHFFFAKNIYQPDAWTIVEENAMTQLAGLVLTYISQTGKLKDVTKYVFDELYGLAYPITG